ncbi:hypothetical protein HU200_008099 [Digitaria exilis]|uniref:Uncharacterized protein n=1 Tax=Digitaria exilis TaxID=1010633 RepID=A0A835FLW2_9POAL|nr:hypothetical protein HU200_008099 [Digitaria exilis]
MAEAEEAAAALQFTPTWIVAAVCSVIVLISVAAERGLHHLGKTLKKNNQWSLYEALLKVKEGPKKGLTVRQLSFIRERYEGIGKGSTALCWLRSFVKQFYGSVAKTDYNAMRLGFIMLVDLCGDISVAECQWLAYVFLDGFPSPCSIGAKLEHVIAQLAYDMTYGLHSCFMDHVGFLVPRLVLGVAIQLICSYSTLPLYAIVTQMGSYYKKEIFNEHVQQGVIGWAEKAKKRSGLRESNSVGEFMHGDGIDAP